MRDLLDLLECFGPVGENGWALMDKHKLDKAFGKPSAKWRDDARDAYFGEAQNDACLALAQFGLINYGVSARTGWLEEQGVRLRAVLREARERGEF